MTRAGLLVALVLLVLAGSAGARSTADPRPLEAKCGNPYGIASAPFWLRAEDGVRLYALEAGSGDVGVVLAHESPADLCGWLPYMATLSAAGLHVLAFDFRGFGDSDRPAALDDFLAYGRDFRAAIARLRTDGARKVFLVGASFGGAAALNYGPDLPVAGVVSMSGEGRLRGTGLNGFAAVRRLRTPLLIVGSRHDRLLSVADALTLLRRAATRDKRTALYPGAAHGWDIVEDAPYAAKARALVLAWIRARS